MIIDEPESLGGTIEGATPVEYLLGALSGCLNVVCHGIAAEMGFTLNSVEFLIEGDLDPAKFKGLSDEGRAGFMEIRATIIADTDASEEVLQDWLERVKSRCPVSDNIANVTPVKISLK